MDTESISSNFVNICKKNTTERCTVRYAVSYILLSATWDSGVARAKTRLRLLILYTFFFLFRLYRRAVGEQKA